jgi:hypothetical protein
MAVGLLDPAVALDDGRVAIEGERDLLVRFFTVFRLPTPAG